MSKKKIVIIVLAIFVVILAVLFRVISLFNDGENEVFTGECFNR